MVLKAGLDRDRKVSIEDSIIANSLFEIYPNPTNDIFNIKFELVNNTNAQIDIFDINGRLVLSIPVQNMKGIIQLQKNEIGHSGTYQCVISYNNNQKQIKKILIIE